MKHPDSQRQFLLASAAILAGAVAIAGCQNQPAHPDEKSAVTNSLNSNNLSNISVSQDRDKGVMTLTGDVPSGDAKTQAENLVKQAAPDYTVADEIGVRPPDDNSQASAVPLTWTAPLRITSKPRSKLTRILTTRAFTPPQRTALWF
jgi:hyperosmotically inducible periplasmic protein